MREGAEEDPGCPDDDDIEIHELLRRLAKQARGLGWSIPKLQDEVFAYFETELTGQGDDP